MRTDRNLMGTQSNELRDDSRLWELLLIIVAAGSGVREECQDYRTPKIATWRSQVEEAAAPIAT